jgi:hypothetical protein
VHTRDGIGMGGFPQAILFGPLDVWQEAQTQIAAHEDMCKDGRAVR